MFLDMLTTEMAKGRDFEVLQAYLAAFLRIHEVALIGHEGLQVETAASRTHPRSLTSRCLVLLGPSCFRWYILLLFLPALSRPFRGDLEALWRFWQG